MTRAADLVLLGLRLARARWRLAWRVRLGPTGLLVGGIGSLLAWSLLVGAGIAFTLVGTTLLAVLLERGRPELAVALAGAVADAGAVLAILAVAAAQETRRGVPPHPLLVLPVRAGDLLLAELVGLLLAEPLAVVAWPTSLVILLGSAQFSPGVALRTVPVAAGVLLFLASLGLAVRRLVLDRWGGRLAGVFLGTGLLFAAPAAWFAAGWRGAGNLLHLCGGPWTPGWWVRQALRAALAGRPAALLPGAALLLVAFGLSAAAALASPASRLPGGTATRRRPALLPAARALVTARPVAAQWAGNTAAALLVLLAGNVFLRQGFPSGIGEWAALIAGLVIAGAPAPVLANLLGTGSPGPLGFLLAGPRPEAILERLGMAALAPSLVVVPALVLLAGRLLPGGAGPFAAAAVAALGAGTGAGFLLSAAWPRAVSLELPGIPLWPPGPGRWIMLLAQGLSLAPLAAGLPRGGVGAVVTGGFAACAGWILARRILRRRILEVTETLLT